jgi:hypothetical protein
LSASACTTKLQQSQDTASASTEIVAGFTPAGIAIDVKDLLQAQTLGEYSLTVLGTVLPGLGDGFKAAIKGADAVPSATTVQNTASGAVSLNQQQMRRAELAEVFDSTQPRSGITVGNQSYLPRADQAVNIYDGLSWDQVQRYFLELTGARELPVGTPVMVNGQLKGTRWTVPDGQGGSYTLRDFASSTGASGRVWTVDVPRSLLPANYKGAPEIKFGQP